MGSMHYSCRGNVLVLTELANLQSAHVSQSLLISLLLNCLYPVFFFFSPSSTSSLPFLVSEPPPLALASWVN